MKVNPSFWLYPKKNSASQVAWVVKNPPAIVGDPRDSGSILTQETRVQSLGREDDLE